MKNEAQIKFLFVEPENNFRTSITMAEINKLSVGKALEKLRTNDVQKSKTARLDEKSKAVDEELQRLRAATRGLLQGQQGGRRSDRAR
jgi:hypothetical protein